VPSLSSQSNSIRSPAGGSPSESKSLIRWCLVAIRHPSPQSPRKIAFALCRPAAAFCDRFGDVPLLAVETDGREDRKTRHHGHDRSLPQLNPIPVPTSKKPNSDQAA
jgi:hypothetical protein